MQKCGVGHARSSKPPSEERSIVSDRQPRGPVAGFVEVRIAPPATPTHKWGEGKDSRVIMSGVRVSLHADAPADGCVEVNRPGVRDAEQQPHGASHDQRERSTNSRAGAGPRADDHATVTGAALVKSRLRIALSSPISPRVSGAARGHAGVVKMSEDCGVALLTPRFPALRA